MGNLNLARPLMEVFVCSTDNHAASQSLLGIFLCPTFLSWDDYQIHTFRVQYEFIVVLHAVAEAAID